MLNFKAVFQIKMTFLMKFLKIKSSQLKEREGKTIDMSLGMCIQSINLESKKANESLSITNSRRDNNGKSKHTPLLDKAQVDSDHE